LQNLSYYWDANGATAGFGTASGTWGSSTFWSTDPAGTSVPAVTSTTTADDVNFGNGATGLGAGSIGTTGAEQGFSTMTFASGSGAITLSAGGMLNLVAATNGGSSDSVDFSGNSALAEECRGISRTRHENCNHLCPADFAHTPHRSGSRGVWHFSASWNDSSAKRLNGFQVAGIVKWLV